MKHVVAWVVAVVILAISVAIKESFGHDVILYALVVGFAVTMVYDILGEEDAFEMEINADAWVLSHALDNAIELLTTIEHNWKVECTRTDWDEKVGRVVPILLIREFLDDVEVDEGD